VSRLIPVKTGNWGLFPMPRICKYSCRASAGKTDKEILMYHWLRQILGYGAHRELAPNHV